MIKKNVTKQINIFRDLLIGESAREIRRATIDHVFRSLVEPVVECHGDALILVKLNNWKPCESVLRRISFLTPDIYAFGDSPEFLKKPAQDPFDESCEFLVILSPRYSAIMTWDYSMGKDLGYENNVTPFYIMLNSRIATEIAKSVAVFVTSEPETILKQYNPERRTNETLNSAIFGVVNTLDGLLTEYSLTEAEKNEYLGDSDTFKKYETTFNKVGNVCHEVKNHLSIIDLYSKIIEKKLTSSDSETENVNDSCLNAVDIIKKSMFSISFLLNNLRDGETKLSPVNLKNMICSVISMLGEKLNRKNINLICDISEEIIILADEIKIQNVILNLLYNSIDAIGEDGQIELSAAVDGRFVQLFVKDNGKGIGEDSTDTLFDAGYTTKTTGQGLGLSICKETMKDLGGKISLEKSDSGLTVFRLDIPLSE